MGLSRKTLNPILLLHSIINMKIRMDFRMFIIISFRYSKKTSVNAGRCFQDGIV
uniref:Uncharacterized protein n=1 Tax=Rhizophora mucronata TaxID=61149 RepID=A0A2P2IUS5_RHIMU